MFRLLNMELVHWDYWQRVSLPLDASIITIAGPNGSGKTTLLDALRTLFAIDCSKKRDYRRYARKNDEEFCWLRGVVDNTRSMSGKHPFFPIMNPQVTLACRIDKKGGEWARQYCIAEGEQGIESLQDTGVWMGVREYQRRLHEAGLSPAISQVLSLEQGQTDKLCEKSPKELLSLVFEVFGDKQVIDRYQEARAHQDATARELDEFTHQLDKLGVQIERTRERVNSYRNWRSLSAEKLRLAAEIRPRIEFQQLRGSILGARSQLTGSRREQGKLAQDIARLQAEQVQHAATIAAAQAEHARLRGDENQANQAFGNLRERIGGLKATLTQRDRLLAFAQQDHQPDPEASARLLGEAEKQRPEISAAIRHKERERDEAQTLLALLQSGQRADPQDVAQLRAALDQAGIAHDLLPEVVEVLDESWQPAVEAVLKAYRQLVLLRREADRGRAFVIGEKLRYRHFIVPEQVEPPSPTPGSLLEVVRFARPAPDWLIQSLNRTQRVEDAERGQHLPRGQDWITRDGYLSERRGGRHAGIRAHEFAFGRARAAALRALAQEREAEIRQLQSEEAELNSRISQHKAQLLGVDATRQLAARAEEFARAAADLATHEAQAAQQGAALAELQAASNAASQRLNAGQIELNQVSTLLRARQTELDKLQREFVGARQDHVERIVRLRHDRAKFPPAWRDRAANEALLAEYESAAAVDREIGRLARQLEEGSWETDSTVLNLLDKYESDFAMQTGEQQRRERENSRAREITQDARAAYLDVLRATVRRYAKNLRTLAEMAGVKVEAQLPHLTADDMGVGQAGLEVKFDFDSKGFIGMNDGDASGGQQVMKSLILLIALMMEESRPGGFVFIDEPFAHLDIFNIDRVAGFLRATRAQYLITTPITHNVNVYDPTTLTLVTYKKRPGEAWAPGIKKLVRAVDA